ncbi:hypothetical protein EIZ87_25020, partial [Escherichia coli]|nr:hypothetical protein [Escherichia coli]
MALVVAKRHPASEAPKRRYVTPMTGRYMTGRYIFHLSLPVLELASAKRFYVEILGATIGRENEEWLDVLLWGHQITLQRRPDEVLPAGKQAKRHFGVVLPWSEWERQAKRI